MVLKTLTKLVNSRIPQEVTDVRFWVETPDHNFLEVLTGAGPRGRGKRQELCVLKGQRTHSRTTTYVDTDKENFSLVERGVDLVENGLKFEEGTETSSYPVRRVKQNLNTIDLQNEVVI